MTHYQTREGETKIFRTQALFGLFAAVAVTFSVACAADTAAPVQNPELNVISVGRDFRIGKNRLPLAILRLDMTSVNDRAQDLQVTYQLSTGGSAKRLDDVKWRAWPVRNGVYVGYPEFDRAGAWEFTVTFNEGGRTLRGSAFVEVKEKTSSPAVGEAAPASETKVAFSAAELLQITSSASPVPSLYSLSLAAAVKSGRPTVVTFSTPAFCTTQTCGPQLGVINNLQLAHGNSVNFLHVEIYDNPREMLEKGDVSIGRVSRAVTEWGLGSEPWTFLIGSNGTIFARFEAFTTQDELESAIKAMLAGI
ncbi:MAG: hypothetical protein EXR44_02770 [Dehalococcoidia bacterium]|nr:hypothetical protein [Dehalococcoidia bacterium]